MSDPLRKVRPGDDLVIPATAYNAFIDAARAHRDGTAAGIPDGWRRAGDVVRVVNDTEFDLPRASVVGIDGPIFGPDDDESAFLREVTLRGVVPEASHVRNFAVLIEPIAAGRVGRACVAGVVQVMVDLIDPGHTHAVAEIGETGALASDDGGPAQILWVEGDAYAYGPAWALVLIGAWCADAGGYYA